MKRFGLAGLALLLVGCPRPQEQSLFVNHRETPVDLLYRGTRVGEGSTTAYCELAKPRVAGETDADGLLESADWREVPHRFDAAACEIELTVPARTTVWIGHRDSCGAVAGGRPEPRDWRPELKLLRVTSGSGALELTGWEVARAFALEKHLFGDDICRLEFR